MTLQNMAIQHLAPRLAALGCLTLAVGCGSRGIDPGTAASPTSRPPNAALVPTPTSVVDTAPPPPETASPSHRCHTGDLAVEFLPGQGATGHSLRTVALHNTARATCTVYGYVGLQPLDGAGRPLPAVVQRGGGMLGTPPPTLVSLPPLAVAYLELEYTSVQSGPSPCPTSAEVEVTPPDETAYLVVRAALSPCAGGRLTITALHGGPPRA